MEDEKLIREMETLFQEVIHALLIGNQHTLLDSLAAVKNFADGQRKDGRLKFTGLFILLLFDDERFEKLRRQQNVIPNLN